jgi:transposase
MLELISEHQVGIPVLMKPLSGNSREVKEFGPVVSAHIAPWHTTYGTTSLVADSALSSEANIQQFGNTQLTWMTRVPATLSDAQAVLSQANPQTMTPLADGYHDRVVPSTDGGVEQRWVLIYAA